MRRPVVRLVVTGVCVALLGLTSTAAAAPTWLPPVDVAPGDTQVAGAPAAAYGESGQVTLAWTSRGAAGATLPTSRRPLGGPFTGGPTLATASGVADPVLARGPGGELHAAWVATDAGVLAVFAARVQPDGTVASAQRLSGPGEASADPAIAVGADGRVAVAWTTSVDAEENGQVRAVHGTLDSTPLTPQVVSAGDANASEPDVAFGPGGVLQVAWSRLDANGDGRIKAAAELPTGAFAASRPISPEGPSATEPAVAAVSGSLAFAWTEGLEDEGTIRVGVESPATPIAITSVAGGGFGAGARLDTDPAGTLYVAWVRTIGGQSAALISARDGLGRLDAPQILSAGDSVSELDLAFSSEGDAVVSWKRSLGTGEDPPGDVRATVFDAVRPGNPPAPEPPAPAPVPAPPPPAPVPSVPSLPSLGVSGFGVTPGCLRYAAPLKPPRGRLGFTFALSEPAIVTLAIQRRLNSSSLRRCPVTRRPGDEGRFGPPLVFEVPSGAGPGAVDIGDEGQALREWTRSASRVRAGSASRGTTRSQVLLQRRLNPGHRRVVLRQSPTALTPGTYVATLTAKTADGRVAGAGLVKFWVLRRSVTVQFGDR